RGDPALLRRMIRNLVEKARHHGGAQTPDVRVGPGRVGRAEIDVRDHGRGIPEAEREKIFAPFYRLAGTAETGRGSGLGLALVRQIARSHGGDVQCLAADGGGSLFRVTLPLAAWLVDIRRSSMVTTLCDTWRANSSSGGANSTP